MKLTAQQIQIASKWWAQSIQSPSFMWPGCTISASEAEEFEKSLSSVLCKTEKALFTIVSNDDLLKQAAQNVGISTFIMEDKICMSFCGQLIQVKTRELEEFKVLTEDLELVDLRSETHLKLLKTGYALHKREA